MKTRATTLKSLLTGLALLCVLAGNVQATTVGFPRLEIVTFIANSDSGVTVGGGSMFVDATVNAIITDISGNSVPLSQEDFTLNATLNGGTGLYDGSLTAGSYLTADFTGLTFLDYGGGASGAIYGSVAYTGGSLQGSYTAGNIDMEFSGTTVAGVLGPVVVPVPAAVWLFGSGLIALVSVARRK
jgi:hypothetical protein